MAETVFARPQALAEVTTHYCPGCTHGTIHLYIYHARGNVKSACINPEGLWGFLRSAAFTDVHYFRIPDNDNAIPDLTIRG